RHQHSDTEPLRAGSVYEQPHAEHLCSKRRYCQDDPAVVGRVLLSYSANGADSSATFWRNRIHRSPGSREPFHTQSAEIHGPPCKRYRNQPGNHLSLLRHAKRYSLPITATGSGRAEWWHYVHASAE